MSVIDVAELKAILTLDDRQFVAGVARSRGELGRFADSAKSGADGAGKLNSAIGAIKWATLIGGAVAAAKALLDFGNDAADVASDVSESVSKINTLFGKSGGEVEKWSQTTAKSLGLSQRAALEAAGNYGNLFRALGVGQDKSAGFSKQLVKLASDMSSFNNTSMEDALAAISSGLRGESEPLSRFGVVLNDVTIKAEAVRKGLMASTKDAMTPQVKALAIMSAMYRQTGAAQGDFAKTSGGLANMQRIVAAQTENLKGKFGELLLPLKLQGTKALSGLLDVFSKFDMKKFLASEPAQNLAKGFVSLRDVGKSIAETVGKAFGGSNGLSTMLSGAKGAVASVTQAFRTGAEAVKQFFASSAGQAAVKGLVQGFQVLGSVTREVVGVALSWWGKLSAWFAENMPLIQRTVSTVLGTIQELWKRHGSQIMAVVTPVWNAVKTIVKGTLDAVLGIVKTAMQVLNGDWSGAWRSLSGVVSTVWATIKSTIANGWEAIKSAFLLFLAALGDLATRFFKAAQSIGTAIIKGILDKLRGLWDSIVQAVVAAPDSIANAGRAVGSVLLSGIKAAIGGNLVPWIVSRLGDVWGQFQRWLAGRNAPVKTASGPMPKGSFDTAWDDDLFSGMNAKAAARIAAAHAVRGAGKSGTTSPTNLGTGGPDLDFTGIKQAASPDDSAAKKAKDAAKRHAEAALRARQEMADKVASITLSEWDQQRRELNKFIAEYKKATGDLVGARKYFALESARISKAQVAAEMEAMDAWLEQGRKESEQFAKDQEAIIRRFLQNVARLPTLTSQIAADAIMTDARDTQAGAMSERAGNAPVRGLAPRIMPKAQTSAERAAAQRTRINDTLRDQFRGASGENFLNALAGGKAGAKRFWGDFVSMGRDSLIKLGWQEVIQPQLKGLFTNLATGLSSSLQGLVATAGTIVNAAMGLLSALSGNGKRRNGALIGAVLGGIAGSFLGPVGWAAGAQFGAGFGGAVGGGNGSEILMSGLAGYASLSGGFRATGAGGGGTNGGSSLPPGTDLNTRLLPVNQTINVGSINNAADLQSLQDRSAANLAGAMRMP